MWPGLLDSNTDKLSVTTAESFICWSINLVHPDLHQSFLGHKVSLENATALIFQHKRPFTRLADSPPKSSVKQGLKKQGTAQISVQLHFVRRVVWFFPCFQVHECKNTTRAVYSPVGLPCHCHQSNALYVTLNHYCRKDGPCINMSGILHC